MTLRLYVKRVCALLLDLDDTSLDGSSFPQTVTRTCEELASLRTGLEARQLQEANHTVFANYGPERLDAWTLGRLSGAELAVEAWRRTLQACGNHDDALAQFAAKTHLRFAWESYQPFPDVAGLMSAVRQARVPIALVTNGAADTQRIKIEALGIASSFSALSISGETGVAKPDKRAFAVVLKALGESGKHVWHVGDSLATDVAGANAAGLTSVWLNRGGKERGKSDAQPDLEVTSLADLTPYILRGVR
ncbi:MAG: HAD family hydrolase [Chloroflexota bacterium]|nr:HAD family hydrolase [Chloroflexota bacterium]MDE2841465.1 HAD family hydrolase [Chloroflexota bacterium]